MPSLGASPPGCTTDYHTINLNDPFAFDFGEDESLDWAKDAYDNLQLQFNMKQFYFNTDLDPKMKIFPNENYYMRFDPKDRRWYTKVNVEDPNMSDRPGLT